MSQIQLDITPIDIFESKITTHGQEDKIVYTFISDITDYLNKNNNTKLIEAPAGSIILNKLVYFITEEVHNINPSFELSRGWYKYGPCFEIGRNSEESLIYEPAFAQILSKKTIIHENKLTGDLKGIVEKVCDEHIPLFKKAIEKDKFPYDYILYIYNKKINEEQKPGFKDYYISKTNLMRTINQLLYNLDYSRNDIENQISILNEKIIDFNKAIMNNDYLKTIKMSYNDLDIITDFNTLFFNILSKTISERSDELLNFSKEVEAFYLNNILYAFSAKNYIKTFVTNLKEERSKINAKMGYGYKESMKKIRSGFQGWYKTRFDIFET